jgi:hypothetical protein
MVGEAWPGRGTGAGPGAAGAPPAGGRGGGRGGAPQVPLIPIFKLMNRTALPTVIVQ